MKRWKQIISAILAIIMVVTVCFPYGIGAKAADAGTTVETEVSAIWSGHNGHIITFQLGNSDWNCGGQAAVVPGSTYNTYNFYNQVQIYYNDGTGEKSVSLGSAHFDQIYYNMWGGEYQNTLSIQLNEAYYKHATKIVIPAGTIFPSFAYTGGTPLGGAAIAGTSSSMNGYIVTEDIIFEGTANASSQTYWAKEKATAVETVMLDLPSSTVRRLAFNIAGDDDNGALANWCYITSSKHDEYNTKDYIEIYLKGESTPKTLKDYYKTTDGNMYWNLYEAGSMTFPLLDSFPDATAVEKIVIKKGCEFPSVAYTGANDPVGGGVFSATTNSKTAYVVQEDVTFIINENATATNASFTFVDTSTTTETAVTEVKTGHNSNVVTFTLSATDYASCSTNRPSEKFADYNFMDKIQIVSGDTVQKLSDVYPSGEQIYYNMWDLQDSFTISLGSAYDTVTKIVIPAGTVFPSATYTGYGAWDATSIPDNMLKNKGGFETTEDIIYEKPDGTGELIWTVAEDEPQAVEVDTTVETLDIKENRFVFNISGDADNDALTESTYIWQVQHDAYNFKDNIEIYVSGESAPKTLRDIFNTSDGNLYWNLYEAGSMSIPLVSGSYDCTKIEKIVIKEGCAFPSVAYTGGNSLTGGSGEAPTTDTFTAYVVQEDMTFVPGAGTSASTSSFVIKDTSTTPETVEVDTTVETLDIKDNRFVFNIAGDGDNDTLTDIIYIWQVQHDAYNFKDKIEIYVSGESGPKTLRDIFDTTDGNLYWNLYEPGSMSIPLVSGSYDCTKIEKIVIKEGCAFPSVAYTGGNSLTGGSGVAATTDTFTAYVVQEDMTFVPGAGTSASTSSFVLQDTSTTPETVEVDTTVETLDIKENRFVFNIAGDGDNDALTDIIYIWQVQHDAYNFKDKIEIYVSGESGPKTLRDIFDTTDGNLYWNLYEAGSMSIPLVSGSYDCTKIEKIVIKEGCAFPSVAYTGGNSLTGGSGEAPTLDSFKAYVVRENLTFVPGKGSTSSVSSFIRQVPTVNEDTEVVKAHLIGRAGNVRLVLFLDKHDYNGIGDSVAVTNKYLEYNSMENIVLCKGATEVLLSEIVTDEVFYNLWGNQGSISYGLKPEYALASFDKVRVKNGCEFPAYKYSSATSTEYKTAYTTTAEKTISISELKYKITYYGENQEVLYEDEVVCGSTFTLRSVPEKEGYTGSWDGLKYDVMPAQNISYTLLYESILGEGTQTEQDEADGSDEKEESPSTGDIMKIDRYVLIMLWGLVVISVVCFMKYREQKKWTDQDGGKNGR